jgi:hypothetical protein
MELSATAGQTNEGKVAGGRKSIQDLLLHESLRCKVENPEEFAETGRRPSPWMYF